MTVDFTTILKTDYEIFRKKWQTLQKDYCRRKSLDSYLREDDVDLNYLLKVIRGVMTSVARET